MDRGRKGMIDGLGARADGLPPYPGYPAAPG